MDNKIENKIDIASRIENLSLIENLIDKMSETYDLGAELYGNILVAIIEAVNNAVRHGNKLDPQKYVHISFKVENGYLIFYIKDEGNGFDFRNIPDPTLPENIEKGHGRGIYLMKNLADEINFFNNGSEVEIKFKLK